MTRTHLKIIQHNIRHWPTNKHTLTNVYAKEDPDIIVINSHGLTDNATLKLHHYTVHQNNKDNEIHSGTAIAIRQNIKYKLIENFYTEMLGITIETHEGPIHIVTTYVPSRHQHIHYSYFYNILNIQEPVYILGELNARHPYFGYGNINA